MDLAQYLAGGAAGRADSISGLTDPFQNALAQMFAAAPEGYLTINSAYRSPEVQARLYADALQRYGSEAEARRWVAPPGNSQHNHGNAVDLGFSGPDAVQWAHDNAARFGLAFPLQNENWHLELAGARDGGQTANQPQQTTTGAFGQQVPAGSDFRNQAPTQNELAALMAPNRDPRENNLAAFMLDPAAFQSRTQYEPVQFAGLAPGQAFATRYLGNR